MVTVLLLKVVVALGLCVFHAGPERSQEPRPSAAQADCKTWECCRQLVMALRVTAADMGCGVQQRCVRVTRTIVWFALDRECMKKQNHHRSRPNSLPRFDGV